MAQQDRQSVKFKSTKDVFSANPQNLIPSKNRTYNYGTCTFKGGEVGGVRFEGKLWQSHSNKHQKQTPDIVVISLHVCEWVSVCGCSECECVCV